MIKETATSEPFSAPARASGFELRKGFQAAQNTTCSVPVDRKSALRGGLSKAGKDSQRLSPVLLARRVFLSIGNA